MTVPTRYVRVCAFKSLAYIRQGFPTQRGETRRTFRRAPLTRRDYGLSSSLGMMGGGYEMNK